MTLCNHATDLKDPVDDGRGGKRDEEKRTMWRKEGRGGRSDKDKSATRRVTK